jgi:hypothetical protein
MYLTKIVTVPELLRYQVAVEFNIVTRIPIAGQRLSIHFPADTQQQELCSLWVVLQLIAM